jgi:hypothetical protein
MARNFGVRPLSSRNNRAPIWPMWVVAFVTIGIINAAMFLPHHH